MQPDPCQVDQLLSLASELLWNTLVFSGENALVLTGAATSQLLLVSERARLHLFLLQLMQTREAQAHLSCGSAMVGMCLGDLHRP